MHEYFIKYSYTKHEDKYDGSLVIRAGNALKAFNYVTEQVEQLDGASEVIITDMKKL
jgi:hypothetical protein